MSDVSGNDVEIVVIDSSDVDLEDSEENETTDATSEIVINTVDYTNYFENLQTMSILILACLVAIGCVLGWVGARRE